MPKNTIYCVQCGAPNFADSRYCTECGSALVKPEQSAKSRKAARAVASDRTAPPAVVPPQRATPPSVTNTLRIPAWIWPVLVVLVVVLSYFLLRQDGPSAGGSALSSDNATAVGNGMPSNWAEYRGVDFTLQLPRDFVGGYTADDAERLSQALSQAGFTDQSMLFEYETMASMGESLKFFAANPADPSTLADMLLVMSTPDIEGMSMETITESYTNMFADSADIDLQQISDFSVPGYETFAVKMDAGDVPIAQGVAVKMYYFILMKDGRVWGMIYMTDLTSSNFGEGDILQSAESFRAN